MTLEQIRNLPPNTINTIVQTKGENSAGLNPEQVQFLLQLNRAAELLNAPQDDASQLAIARTLQNEFPQISLRTARRRVAEAVAYLYQEQHNTPEQWHEFYADKFDRLAAQAIVQQDLKTALACFSKAHELRAKAADNRVDPTLTQFRQILVSPDVINQRIGLNPTGMRELLREAYQLIEQSTLPDKEKQRLKQDANLCLDNQ